MCTIYSRSLWSLDIEFDEEGKLNFVTRGKIMISFTMRSEVN